MKKKSGLMILLLLTAVVLLVSACSNAATPAGASASSTGNDEVKALIDERCSVCHSANQVYRANYDEAGWSDVIDTMIKRGAVVSEEEKALMIEWLLAQP
jgi:uncharacterized membrane protein